MACFRVTVNTDLSQMSILTTASVSSMLNFEKTCLKTLSLLDSELGAACDSDVTLPSLKMLNQL